VNKHIQYIQSKITIMKNIYKMKTIFTGLLLLFLLTMTANAQKVVYVTADGSGDGSSWATAGGSIQDAIQAATEATDIWIKAGTYYVPGDTTFILKDEVSLYGGFAGTETCPVQRVDFRMGGANETILSGDINKNGITDAANANRIMYGKEISAATTLDGLTISGGYADATSGEDGGGLRLASSSPMITNCTIFDNFASDNGGGFYIFTSSGLPSSLPTVTGCYFVKNYANDKGGGAYTGTGCDAVFTNCVFENNEVRDDDGAAFYVWCSSPVVMNCTFVRNVVPGDEHGAAVAVDNSSTAPVTMSPSFINSVFWGNLVGAAAGEDIYLFDGLDSPATITNCALEGTHTATGATATGTVDISSTDPLFVNTSGTAGTAGHDAAADWDIQTSSVLISAGLAAGAPGMDVNSNFRDATIDIGAYEFGATVPLIIATDITGPGSVTPNGAYLVSGSDQILVITPDPGFEITSATYNAADIVSSLVDNGDGSFSYTATAVVANGILAVTYEAMATQYTVTLSAETGGTINPTGDITVTVTDVTAVVVTPGVGFVFSDLLLNDVSVKDAVTDEGDGTFTYSLTAVGENGTLKATFLEVFTVTFTAGANGSISPTGTLDVSTDDDTEVTITANTGYILGTCTLGGVDIIGDVVDNTDGTYTYTLSGVDADLTLEVTFSEITVNVIYLKTDGTGDGSSWASAKGDLQATIDAGVIGDEIWVAKGTYIVPTDTSFTLKNGVSLYGGFAGTESTKEARRDYRLGEANETKLSADIDGNGFLTGGNAPRVIFGEFISSLTTIDGFTITGGFSDVEKSNGAGMKLRASSPNILNCTFFDNYCDDGGALYLYRSGDIVSSPKVMNCYFIKGFANDDGGAMYLASGTQAEFINCVFAYNFANDEGGAVRNYECSPRFINCSFVYNALPDVDPTGGGTYGPAVRNYQTSSPYMNTEPDFINCVFWRNQDGDATHSYDVSNTGNIATAGATPRVINCAVMDSISSSCIIIDTLDIGPADGSYLNPGFVNVSGDPGYIGYNAEADWRLVETSPMIDAGTTSETGVPLTDLNGFPRSGGNDIGAFELGSVSAIKYTMASQDFDGIVYPNPSNGSFRVKTTVGTISTIEVFDITGRVIHTGINSNSGDEAFIDLGRQEKGLFILKITKTNGHIGLEKVIVK
jgi:hypothetical protein